MKPAVTRIVGYVRVSTEEQVDGRSLDAQRREIERYADQNGLTLVGIYADEGVSAHTDRIEKRPQLSALIADASRGSFDAVVVHTIDRWARNIRVQTDALQRLGKAGVGFISLTENIDFPTPSGKLMLTMIGGFSEFFSDQLAVHVVKSQRQRAESGLPVGPIPFGYVPSEAREAPIVDPEAGEAVREAFAARAAGQSNGAIAAMLNRDGFRTKKGHLFTAHAMKDLFNCRFYTGIVTFRGEEFPGQHEALISSEPFERLQARRVRRGPHRRVAGKPRGVLAGIIKCARCGNSLHAERGRESRAMYRERHGRECPTNRRSLMAHAVDEQISAILRSLELSADWRDQIAGYTADTGERNIDSLQENRQRLVRAYADGGFSLAEYEARLAAIDAEIRHALGTTPIEVGEVAALLGDLPGMWDEATPDERRRLVAPIVERVFVDVETKRISGLVPMPGFRTLIGAGMQETADAAAVLFPPEYSPAGQDVGVGGDGGESNSPSSRPPARIYYGCSRRMFLAGLPPPTGVSRPASVILATGARGARQ